MYIALLIILATASIGISYLIYYNSSRKKELAKKIKTLKNIKLPKPFDPTRDIIICKNINASSEISSNDLTKNNIDYEKFGIKIAGIEALYIYGIDILDNYAAIDHHVYESMERFSGKEFDSFSDLSQQFSSYVNNFWTGLPKQTIESLSGHLAEGYAAENIQKSGIEIKWPEHSNNSGWDLLLNGHEVNVKIMKDTANSSFHYDKYPDIPIWINEDAKNIPEHAHFYDPEHPEKLFQYLNSDTQNKMIVDESLNLTEMQEQIELSSDAFLGSADIVDGHIPIITLALSGWREINLLEKSSTDVITSAKNLGLDVIGTSVGAFTGAKGGTVLGTLLFGPIGGALGGLAGAIYGAIKGREFSNEKKIENYKNALSRFEESSKELINIISNEDKKLTTQIKKIRREEEKKIEKLADIEKKYLIECLSKMKSHLLSSQILHKDESEKMLTPAINKISKLEKNILSEYRNLPFYEKNIFPTLNTWVLKECMSKIKKIKATLNSMIKQNSLIKKDVIIILANMGLSRKEILNYMIKSNNAQRINESQVREVIYKSRERIMNRRKESIARILDLISNLTKDIKVRLKPLIDEVRNKASIASNEAKKLG